MTTHVQPNPAGRGNGTRRAMSGTVQYMSERQTQAYLMARDAIRRIQRASPIVEAIAKDKACLPRASQGRPDSH